MSVEQILVVEWIDAFGCPAGWEFEDEAEVKFTTVHSVGYLLKEDADCLFLAPHVSSPGEGQRRQLAGHIAIPRRSIISSKVISLSAVELQARESGPPNDTVRLDWLDLKTRHKTTLKLDVGWKTVREAIDIAMTKTQERASKTATNESA